ncbi:DUF4276 family protein [Leptothrix sp. BB-4]
MITRVCPIVEGDGEVLALPVLLRRIARQFTPHCAMDVLRPIRVHRMTLLNRPDEFERYLRLAANYCGSDDLILILLDADDDCPVTLAASLRSQAERVLPHRRVAVVLANREFEAWFIAAADSLVEVIGLSLLPDDQKVPSDSPRDAKGWLGKRMGPRRYHPISDQATFARHIDLQMARERSRSFRKLCDDWERHTLALASAATINRPTTDTPP